MTGSERNYMTWSQNLGNMNYEKALEEPSLSPETILTLLLRNGQITLSEYLSATSSPISQETFARIIEEKNKL